MGLGHKGRREKKWVKHVKGKESSWKRFSLRWDSGPARGKNESGKHQRAALCMWMKLGEQLRQRQRWWWGRWELCVCAWSQKSHPWLFSARKCLTEDIIVENVSLVCFFLIQTRNIQQHVVFRRKIKKNNKKTGGCKHRANPSHCGRSRGHHSGWTGGTGAVMGIRLRRRRSKDGTQHHGQRHQSPVGWEQGGRRAATFSVSHADSFRVLGGNCASLNWRHLDT